jgi:hypothetical protein
VSQLLEPVVDEFNAGLMAPRIVTAMDVMERGVASATQELSDNGADTTRAALKEQARKHSVKQAQTRRASTVSIGNREKELEGQFKHQLKNKIVRARPT